MDLPGSCRREIVSAMILSTPGIYEALMVKLNWKASEAKCFSKSRRVLFWAVPLFITASIILLYRVNQWLLWRVPWYWYDGVNTGYISGPMHIEPVAIAESSASFRTSISMNIDQLTWGQMRHQFSPQISQWRHQLRSACRSPKRHLCLGDFSEEMRLNMVLMWARPLGCHVGGPSEFTSKRCQLVALCTFALFEIV